MGNHVGEHVFLLCAAISAAIVLLILAFMIVFALPLFGGGPFFHIVAQPWAPHKDVYGIYPMITGTLAVSFLGILWAFPVSLGCAALIAVLDRGAFSRFLKKVVQLMTGVPTVIYGFVGLFLLVPFIRELFYRGSGMCVLSASLMIALLVSPTMILFFTDSFESVPSSYLLAVDALGGSKVQKLIHVALPLSLNGILTGLVLALGRAFGDTLIALMIAGNAVQVPGSLLDSARTLTAHIALVVAADYESMEFKSIFACGIILYFFTTLWIVAIRSASLFQKRVNR